MKVVGLILMMLVDAYVFLIFLWVLGSWIQQWKYQEWYRMISGIVEPYINLFRGLHLHMGMMDLSPAVAMLFLSLFRQLLVSVMRAQGLL